jgi:hypothetical protein
VNQKDEDFRKMGINVEEPMDNVQTCWKRVKPKPRLGNKLIISKLTSHL